MTTQINTFPVNKCFICNSDYNVKYKNLNDRIFGQSTGWDLCQCKNKNCGLMWLNPMPTKEDIGKAYESYYTHSDNKKPLINLSGIEKAYQNIRYGYKNVVTIFEKIIAYGICLFPVLKNRFDFNILYLPKVSESAKILDFGCGNGWILDNLKQIGWDCYGLDFDAKAVEFCKSKGLKVELGDIESQKFPQNYFDAIVVNHVIEHIYEIDEFLALCFEKLKTGGRLVIATPNTDNWQHTLIYKNNWMPLDAPRHLNIFNVNNLKSVVERNGFKVEQSFTSIRTDAWISIVSRNLKKKPQFIIGKDKKSFTDLMVGLFHQQLSIFIQLFNKKLSGEVIVIAKKE